MEDKITLLKNQNSVYRDEFILLNTPQNHSSLEYTILGAREQYSDGTSKFILQKEIAPLNKFENDYGPWFGGSEVQIGSNWYNILAVALKINGKYQTAGPENMKDIVNNIDPKKDNLEKSIYFLSAASPHIKFNLDRLENILQLLK